jgi:hypothetical protein
MTRSPELRLFRAIITQAIDDAMYDGLDKYKDIEKAIHYLEMILERDYS